jgi:hypothetical protein
MKCEKRKATPQEKKRKKKEEEKGKKGERSGDSKLAIITRRGRKRRKKIKRGGGGVRQTRGATTWQHVHVYHICTCMQATKLQQPSSPSFDSIGLRAEPIDLTGFQ